MRKLLEMIRWISIEFDIGAYTKCHDAEIKLNVMLVQRGINYCGLFCMLREEYL